MSIVDGKFQQRENIKPKTQRSQKSQEEQTKQLLMTQKRLEGLKDSLQLLDIFINNEHMEMLSPANKKDLYESQVIQLENSKKNRSQNISICRLDKIMYNVNEDNFEKLVSVYLAMYGFGGIVGLIIQSDGQSIQFYLCTNTDQNQEIAGQLLQSNINGQFPGCTLTTLNSFEKEKLLDSFSNDLKDDSKAIVKSLSIIPGRRQQEQEKGRVLTSQGFEKFIETMNGKSYTLLILAQKVSPQTMDLAKSGYENMYTSLSPYAKEQVSFAQSEADTLNFVMSQGIGHSTAHSISSAYGSAHTLSISKGRTKNSGSNFSFVNLGFGSGSAYNEGFYKGDSQDQHEVTGDVEGYVENINKSKGEGKTFTQTKTMTISKNHKSVIEMLEKLDALIKRIETSQIFGMWNSACYVVTKEASTASIATSTLTSLLAGDNKSSTHAYINEWNNTHLEDRNRILENLGHLYHPEIELTMYKEDENHQKTFLLDEFGKPVATQILTPALMVSGKEIPIMLSLPGNSVPGIVVDHMAEFGRNVSQQWIEEIDSSKKMEFGNIYHMGKEDNQKTVLNLDTFASHCFICGAPGAGKSNTAYNLLYEMIRRHIPFLVIEPVKGEYKIEFGALKNINILTAAQSEDTLLQINPFEFHPRIHIREHLDKLISTISACWPLYGTMPGLLKQAFERVYIEHGWDLENSKRIIEKGSKFPTFRDLETALDDIIENSTYSRQSKSDYKGALLNRVSSLNNGFESQIFGNSIGISDKILFDSYTIIDLSSIGSEETKSLIMGILIIRLQEYRKATRDNPNASLKHVTVLEEAHNILKKCSQDTNIETGNMQGQSVKMLCNCIAEMRSFGEGFVIIDQSPSSIDETAIKNTAIKIVMRLPDKYDCEVMAAALSLEDNQMRELSRLDIGVGAIYHVGWTNTILAKMGKVWDKKCLGNKKIEPYNKNSYIQISGAIVQLLYYKIHTKDFYDLKEETIDLLKLLSNSKSTLLPISKQKEIMNYLHAFFENNTINIKKKNDKVLKTELIGFIYYFLKLQSFFKVVTLSEVNTKPSQRELNQKEKIASLRWFNKLKDLLGQYIVMPESVNPDKYIWPHNPEDAMYYLDILRELIYYYGLICIQEKSDYSYLNALDYLDKIGVFSQ